MGAGVTSWQAHARPRASGSNPVHVVSARAVRVGVRLRGLSVDQRALRNEQPHKEAGKPVGANDTLKDRVAVLEQRVNEHDTVHRRLEFKIDNLTDEVVYIKSDVEVLKTDVRVLKTDMSEVKDKIGVITDDVAELKARTSDLGEIRARVAEIPEIKASQIKVQDMVAQLLARAERVDGAANAS
jgi:chromosome segregation ATPase